MKKHNILGNCGISCGLCPRFQSKSESRCLGCGPDAHCAYCSIFRCSATKRKYETCAECGEFPCKKYEKWFDTDSFVTHQKCLSNIQEIKAVGIDDFLKEQKQRKKLLEIMLEKYNPGKCMSLYCLASSLISIKSLTEAWKQSENVRDNKPKALKLIIQELSEKEHVNLRLRR
jgi:hypothetical protein